MTFFLVRHSGIYQYNLKDHLGNTRAMYSKSAGAGQAVTLVQSTDYYPFGKSFENVANTNRNRYLYNGKELQDQVIGGTALGWYDYEKRFYDPEVPHFTSMDPLAEKHFDISPYAYCANNPIKYIDPDGQDYTITIQRDSKNSIIGITFNATIFIQGDGASNERAKELTNLAMKTYKSKDEDGVSVGFKVN